MSILIITWFSLNKITRLMVKWYGVKRVNILFLLCIWNTFFMKQDIFSDAYWFENIEILSIFFLWNSQIVFEFFFQDSSFSSLIKTSKYWEMIWMDLRSILQKLYHIFINILIFYYSLLKQMRNNSFLITHHLLIKSVKNLYICIYINSYSLPGDPSWDICDNFLDFTERGEGLLDKDVNTLNCHKFEMIYLETGVSVLSDIRLSVMFFWAKADIEYFLE